MKHKLPVSILMGLIIAVLLFHSCIIFKIIPYDIAWGGRLQNYSEMYVFEAVSMIINLFLGLLVLMKAKWISFRFPEKVINVLLWLFFVLFVLNTIGNLFAKTNFEKYFSVLTLTFAVLILLIIKKKDKA